MHVAFSKPTPDDATFSALMNRYRSAGYEGLQLKMGQFMPWVSDAPGYMKQWGDDPARVSGIIHFDTLDPDGVERLTASVKFAEEVAGERVIFCHNHPREGITEKHLKEFARTLSAIGSHAAARGVALSLHHHFDQPVMHPADFEIFFDTVEPGTVGLTVDTAHLAKSGIEDIPRFIKTFAHRIDNVHFKDYLNGEWRLLGEGSLDLVGILAALESSGYNGWLCVDEESNADLQTGLVVSRQWLDTHL